MILSMMPIKIHYNITTLNNRSMEKFKRNTLLLNKHIL